MSAVEIARLRLATAKSRPSLRNPLLTGNGSELNVEEGVDMALYLLYRSLSQLLSVLADALPSCFKAP